VLLYDGFNEGNDSDDLGWNEVSKHFHCLHVTQNGNSYVIFPWVIRYKTEKEEECEYYYDKILTSEWNKTTI